MANQEISQFDHQFNAVLDLTEWNEATGGQNAWFRSERAKGGAPQGDYVTDLVRLTEARRMGSNDTFVPGSGVAEPEWMADAARIGVRLTFSRTRLSGQGETIRETQEQAQYANRHAWQRIPGEWRSPPNAPSSSRPADLGRVCLRWSLLADNAQDLGKPVRVYLDRVVAGRPEAEAATSRIAANSMRRSLEIAMQNGLPYASNADYLDILARLDLDQNDHNVIFKEVAELALRAILLDKPITKGLIQQKPPKVPTSLAFEAVQELDTRGFLTPEWWMGTCIDGGGAITVPELLPIVYQKLAGDDGSELLANVPGESAQVLIRSYVAVLLRTYAQDRTRDRIAATKILKGVIDKRGSADLFQLIAVANAIIGEEDKGLRPEQRRSLLDMRSMFSVGDALLIVLEKTRPASATNEQWAAQFDQDVCHAEIVDTIHARLRHDRNEAVLTQMADNSLRFRYPFSSTRELNTIRGRLTSGQSPASVRALFRSRQDAAISGWRLRKPGSGYMS